MMSCCIFALNIIPRDRTKLYPMRIFTLPSVNRLSFILPVIGFHRNFYWAFFTVCFRWFWKYRWRIACWLIIPIKNSAELLSAWPTTLYYPMSTLRKVNYRNLLVQFWLLLKDFATPFVLSWSTMGRSLCSFLTTVFYTAAVYFPFPQGSKAHGHPIPMMPHCPSAVVKNVVGVPAPLFSFGRSTVVAQEPPIFGKV